MLYVLAYFVVKRCYAKTWCSKPGSAIDQPKLYTANDFYVQLWVCDWYHQELLPRKQNVLTDNVWVPSEFPFSLILTDISTLWSDTYDIPLSEYHQTPAIQLVRLARLFLDKKECLLRWTIFYPFLFPWVCCLHNCRKQLPGKRCHGKDLNM